MLQTLNERKTAIGDFPIAASGLADLVKELAALENLTTLDLSNARATDAGMKELAALKNLTTLGLSGTSVTGAGMKESQPHDIEL